MRHLFMGLIFGLAGVVLAQELVRNGGFNDPRSEYGVIPPDWLAEPSGAGWAYVNDDGVLGGDPLADAVAYTAGTSGSRLVQTIACQPETEYLLSAALKANGCVPMVEVVGVGGAVLASFVGDGDRHGVWKVFERTFSSGKNRELTIRLTGDLTGGAVGKSGFDRVSVQPAGVAVEPAAGTAAVSKPLAASGENIALNKPYTLSPAPSYGYCTDPADETQLTDGVYTQGYFWVQKSTVGWTRGMPIVVTIDLGREEPISGVSWNTAAGVAGVVWPTGLQVYVSSDQKTWYCQGDLTVLGTQDGMPPAGKYGVFRYATDSLQTKGRWVRILISQRTYAFCDEIEVYRGQDAWLALAAGGEATAAPTDHFWEQQLMNGIRRRLQADLLTAEENLSGLPPSVGLSAAVARIPALRAGLDRLPAVAAATFAAILPLSAEHEAILGLNALCLQAAGFSRPFLWRSNRWDNLSLTALPPTGADGAVAPLQVAMMRGEVRGETVNLCNPAATALDYVVTVDGLPPPAALRLCEVLVTDTQQGEPIAAALQPTAAADGSLRLRVPGGCTRQIWLSFRRPNLADGVYQGRLIAKAAGQPELTVGVTLRIAGQFPAAATLHVGGWDYTNGKASYYGSPDNLADNLAIMRDIYVDSPWATSAVMPKGAAFDAEGRLTNADKLDYRNWDEWVDRWRGARKYCVFMSVVDKFMGEAMGTDRFNRMVGDYMTAWADYLRRAGMQPSQLVVLLLDEPHRNEQDRIIIAWAKAIRAAKTGILIFEDPTYGQPEDGLPEMYELSDVLCPNTPMMLTNGEAFKQFYVQQRIAGRELWLYSCSGPAKLLDPIAYHRAQQWRAFELGAKGSFYWALGCGGGCGDSWNAYSQPGTEYSPYFVSKTTVMDGKHSEAIREGVQDYEYLVMLQERIVQAKKAGQGGAALARAEALLVEAPGRALANVLPGSLDWRTARDRGLMDQVRIEILQTLAELR